MGVKQRCQHTLAGTARTKPDGIVALVYYVLQAGATRVATIGARKSALTPPVKLTQVAARAAADMGCSAVQMKSTLFLICGIAAVFALLYAAGDFSRVSALLGFLALAVLVVVTHRMSADVTVPVVAPPEEPANSAGGSARAIVNAIKDPAVIVDAQGTVVLCNDGAEAVFGHLPAGHRLASTVRAPALLEALETVTATRQAVDVDYELRVPLDQRFEVHLAPLLLEGDAGDDLFGCVLILLRDLTQQEKVERMRADFVAHASHELRTPLAAVLGFIETLQGAAKNDADARQTFLGFMQAQATRMSRLVDDLLSLSRIELNAHIRPGSTVDLEQTVRHVLEFMAPLAREADMEISTSFPDRPVPVQGDRDELVQVIQNLLENAMKYGQSGKQIEIGISRLEDNGPERSANIWVRDHGPGISPQHVPRLTERFYRVDVGESRARGGTGLGLAIVKHIVSRHRGRLLVESELGKGSTFTVQLPAKKAEEKSEIIE